MPDTTFTTSRQADPYYRDVPGYMTDVYDWCYVSPGRARLLDRNLVVKVLLFGNDRRLMRAYLDEIRPGMRVWQAAHVYGDLITRAADAVGPEGLFRVTDITPVQVEHGARKLDGRPWAAMLRHDAATYAGEGAAFDLICSFLLMHELPDDKKRQVLDHLLAMLPADGVLLLVDYHRPAWWQPVRWVLKVVNACLEPFADALWGRELSDFASHPERFDWEKRTLFGGVYQVVKVRPRGRASPVGVAGVGSASTETRRLR